MMTVNSKVIVEASEDTLSVRVGHGIHVKLGKDGIVLDKFQGSQENIIQDKSHVSFSQINTNYVCLLG